MGGEGGRVRLIDVRNSEILVRWSFDFPGLWVSARHQRISPFDQLTVITKHEKFTFRLKAPLRYEMKMKTCFDGQLETFIRCLLKSWQSAVDLRPATPRPATLALSAPAGKVNKVD